MLGSDAFKVFPRASRAWKSGFEFTIVWKDPTKVNTKISGVKSPITLVTFSKSIIPTTIIKTVHIKDPIQESNPNCWFKLEPAPAIITKPIKKQFKSRAKSINFVTNFSETSSSTSMWLSAMKWLPSWRIIPPTKMCRIPTTISPKIPGFPKETKYCISSWPLARPAPVSTPT